MRLRGQGLTLTGPEGASPPLPFVTVADDEAAVLLSLYPTSIVRVSDDEAALEVAEGGAVGIVAGDLIVPAVIENGAPVPTGEPGEFVVALSVDAEDVSDSGDSGDSEGKPSDADQRSTDITEAIDLLETDDYVSTGARKGRPKVKAIEEIVGFDVTVEEVDKVFAARSAG